MVELSPSPGVIDRQTGRARGWAWPAVVFLLSFLVFLALTPQFMAELDPPTGDEPFYLQMAISLWHDHDFEMSNNYSQGDYLDFYPKVTVRPPFRGWESFPADLPAHQSATLRPGLYEKHGVGLAVLEAPAYAAGGRAGAMVLVSLMAALLAANIFLLAREVSGSLWASLATTGGLVFSSPLLAYAFLVFPAVPAALLAVYAFRRARLSPDNNGWQVLGVGICLAFLPWLHAGYLLLSAPLFAYYISRNRSVRNLVSVLAPVAVSGALFLFYYYYLYGTIVPNYGDHAGFRFPLGTIEGMVGLLLDQQWGLVTYSPFYLAAIAGIILMWRRRQPDLRWMSLATVPVFLFFSSYGQWWGEWCPPARYLVPILPFAAAPAALLLKEMTAGGKVAAGVLLGVSVFLMGSFAAAPKLMYNHPSGQSQLFMDMASRWGLDLTTWVPSFANAGPEIIRQAALALVVAGTVVIALLAFASRPVPASGGAGYPPELPGWLPVRLRGQAPVEMPAPLSKPVWGWQQALVLAALAVVLVVGAYFRLTGMDWDSGQHMHPDERFITMVATDIRVPSSLGEYFDSAGSQLNPINHNFPSYSYGTSFLFLAKFLSGPAGMEGYDAIVMLGRFLSAVADLGTVLLLFFLGRRLYNRWTGLLAALLYAGAALPIQHSHFFVAESFTTFFVVLTLYMAVRVSERSSWPGYLGMGAACGLALGSKVSVALLIAVVALAAGMAYRKRRDLQPAAGLALALVAMFVAFRIVQPYAFGGSGFFDLRPSPFFWGAIEEQRRMAEGSVEFPYTLQYAGTVPFLFHIQNLFWGLGPALLAAAAGGLGLAGYELVRRRRFEHLLVVAWVVLAFLYFGGQYVKYMRYLLPIYPLLALLAGYLLWRVGSEVRRRVERPGRRALAAWAVVILVVAGTLAWAWAYTRIYSEPLTRVQASQWIYANVAPGSAVAVEHWDDPLPLIIPEHSPQQYRQLSLELYNDDNPAKLEIMINQLDQADYIFISSNRLYGSIPRLPLRYPLTSEYYRLLFGGELGFQRAAVFESYPSIGPVQLVDDKADESFTVYDHPKVQIFKKAESFSRERVRQLLSRVSLDNIVRQGPKGASTQALMLAPDLVQADRAGGTWSEIFDPDGLPARFPFVSWYLLVQILSLALLPLGLIAFRTLPDRGYPLLKALGILVVSYLAWLLAGVRVAPYSRTTIFVVIAVLALASSFMCWRWRSNLRRALRENWRVVTVTEVLFLAAFLGFYLIRIANPDLWHAYRGGEKPMDVAFLNAVIKSTYFPPYDPWFSGGYMNYYYFGQVIVGTLTKITAIPTAIAYNLAVPLMFALTVLGAFSAGHNLSAIGVRGRSWRVALAGGILSVLFVAVIGNLDGLVQLVQGLSKMSPHPVDNPWPGVAGMVNAWSGLGERLAGRSLPQFDFWRSSRMMSPTFSITEFPYFTFLFADLHAHLVGLPFTLLALGSILSLANRRENSGPNLAVRALVAALSLGALWAINSWDFPTYFLLAGAVLLAFGSRRAFTWPGLVRNLLVAGGIFVAAYALFYPFHGNYQQFYAGINPSPEKTPLYQYLGVHGLFLLIIGAYLLTRVREGLRRFPGGRSYIVLTGIWVAALVGILLSLGLSTAAFLVVMLAVTGVALLAARDRAAILAVLLVTVALILGLGVEFVTIKGDIQRMNTVFKFYLQVWVLMAVASSYCLTLLLRMWLRPPLRWPVYVWMPLVLIAIWGSLLYPVGATPVRVADRFENLAATDNGMAFMQHASYPDEKGALDLALDYRAITWMQKNITGSPVVLEGNAPLYHWGSRISIYTGLPTVIGWDWHEKQQRAAYEGMVESRLADVRTMYSTPDPEALLRLLRKYDVSYVYVGQLEQQYYPAGGMEKFQSLEGTALHRVYEDGPVSIYRVEPTRS